MYSTKDMNPAEFMKKVLGEDYAKYEERILASLAKDGFVMVQYKEDGTMEVVQQAKVVTGRKYDTIIIDERVDFKGRNDVVIDSCPQLSQSEFYKRAMGEYILSADEKDFIALLLEGVPEQLSPYRGWPDILKTIKPKEVKKKLPFYHGKRRF